MGEINEAYGRGKAFEIDGARYEVYPCPNRDMEEATDMYAKIITSKFLYNFVKFADEEPAKRMERIEAIYWLLDKAFRGKVDRDVLEQIDRKTSEEIINFFLVD